jgi:aminoglycoside phosphotransferase family enzyme
MWPFRPRHRFREVVDRQLAIFAADHADLVTDARSALARYHAQSNARDALEQYGDHDSLAEQVEEHLDDMYRHFAATLEPDAAQAYRKQFARRAKAMYGDLLPRLTFDSKEDQLPE